MVTGIPAGLSEPYFDTLDGEISKAVFAVPGVKGVSFCRGFCAAAILGSENNDAYRMDVGKIVTVTNNTGGILGGMASDLTLEFSVAF